MRFRNLAPVFMLLILLSGCSTDDVKYGLGDFRMDMATVVDLTQGRGLQLDNLVVLMPNSVLSTDLKSGSRVLVNYVVNEKKSANSFSVSLNGVSSVNSSTIKPLGANAPDDPLVAEAVWQTGDWLNLRIAFDYLEKKHSIELDQRLIANTDTIYLELRHAKNGDANGYWVKTYLSFPLKAYAQKGKSVPIKLRVNSDKEGVRYFYFNYISPTQN
ncbi:MAG: hypothetical protein ACOYOT_02940 [Bacteroidales bacterium]